jgi:hypothetical protein
VCIQVALVDCSVSLTSLFSPPAHTPSFSPQAIDALVRVQAALVDYSVNNVTEGIEALATTRVVIRPAGKLAGEGYVTDTKVGGSVTEVGGSSRIISEEAVEGEKKCLGWPAGKLAGEGYVTDTKGGCLSRGAIKCSGALPSCLVSLRRAT